MSLRDELELELCTLSNDVGTILSVCQAAQIVDWLEQKLSEAQAETVERLRRDLETPPPDVQEKVIKMLDLVSRDALKKADKQARDVVLPFLEQRLTEAQAEMVERCANRVDAYRGVAQKQTAWTWGEVNNLLVDLREQVRALSPDPHAKQRWELEARLMEERVYGYHDPLTHTLDRKSGEVECSTCQRIADLERQLAALPEVKK